jgi:hypothetical protein
MPTCLRHRYIPYLIQNAEYLHFDIQSQGHLPENKLHLWHYSIFYVFSNSHDQSIWNMNNIQ